MALAVLCSFLGEENVIAVPLGSRSVRITVKGPAHLCKWNLVLTVFISDHAVC